MISLKGGNYNFSSIRINRQVELHKKVAAEVEAEGQRILQLQAELAKQGPPQTGHYQPENHGQYQQQGQQGQYQHQAQASYQGQSSNQVNQGYNHNAQPIGGAKPQQNYLPPQKYGKK